MSLFIKAKDFDAEKHYFVDRDENFHPPNHREYAIERVERWRNSSMMSLIVAEVDTGEYEIMSFTRSDEDIIEIEYKAEPPLDEEDSIRVDPNEFMHELEKL